jgi:hypothetical protein
VRAQWPHARDPQAGSRRAGVNILAAWTGRGAHWPVGDARQSLRREQFLLVPLLQKLSFDYYINLGDVSEKRAIFSAIPTCRKHPDEESNFLCYKCWSRFYLLIMSKEENDALNLGKEFSALHICLGSSYFYTHIASFLIYRPLISAISNRIQIPSFIF